MARIRTIKPEAFRSRTIKKLSFPARWTFEGLVVHADDKGRVKDDIDLIRADIYPLEMDEVSIKDVEAHIQEMLDVEMLCRYQVNGSWYLHFINFSKHQRINRPSESHLPGCPYHEDDGSPKPGAKPPAPKFTEPSGHPHAPLSEGAVSPQASRARPGSGSGGEMEEEEELAPLASVTVLPVAAPKPPTQAPAAVTVALFECAPAARSDEPAPPIEPVRNSQTLIAEWVDFRVSKGIENKPTDQMIGRVGKELKKLLAEVSYDIVRQGLVEWSEKSSAPTAIPSFVDRVQSRRAQGTSGATAARPSAATLRKQTGLDLMQEFAAEEGVDLATIFPNPRREITA